MAKLHSYYVLCPLIDQKSFLGITGDKKRGEVLVTLGRNVVNKYRLSDQKQTGGWSSKEHITAAVIFDILQESYVGVFNNNTIKLWKDSDNLDKVKKFKLPQNILKLIPREENTYLVFSNGNTASLPYAVENRKSIQVQPVLNANEVIIDSDCYSQDTNHIVYFTKNDKGTHEIITCPLREELGDIVIAKLTRNKVCRPDGDVNITGHLINVKSKCPRVYILWSDSKLIVYDLQKKLWKSVGKVPWISTQSSVSMWPLGDTHLILFGSNTNQDGAIIMVYDLSLGIGSCQYPMKMYSKNAKLFISENYIILETTNHIGVLSYMLETKRNLSMLLGSHEIVKDDVTVIANWDTPSEPLFNVKPEFKNLLSQGLSERAICSQVLPQLLEKKNISEILEVLKQFKDIPESAIVHTLNFILKAMNINIDIIDAVEFANFCTKNDSEFQKKLKLLNIIFQVPFSDALLIPYLRNGLCLDDALFLMTYISYLLFESDQEFDIEYESKLLDWCTLLMDAFYQQYLMTKDDKVTYSLGNMLHAVASLIEQLREVDNTLPLVHKVLAGKPIVSQEGRTSYAIELMEI